MSTPPPSNGWTNNPGNWQTPTPPPQQPWPNGPSGPGAPYPQPGYPVPGKNTGGSGGGGKRPILLWSILATIIVIALIAAVIITTRSSNNKSADTTAAAGNSLTPATDTNGTVTQNPNPYPVNNLWDPCQIPQQILDKHGLYGNTMGKLSSGPAWDCNFNYNTATESFGFGTEVSTFTFQQQLENPQSVTVANISLPGGHRAIVSNQLHVTSPDCWVIWGTSYGSAAIDVMKDRGNWDACTKVQQFIADFYPLFPK